MHKGGANTPLCASSMLMSRLPDSWLSASFCGDEGVGIRDLS